MKSFVAYPLDFEKYLFPENSAKSASGKLFAHYELYKSISHLNGSIVKCGVAAEEDFTKFAMFRAMVANCTPQKVIAFEKLSKDLYYENSHTATGTLQYKLKRSLIDIDKLEEKLQKKGITEKVEFVPGQLGDAIPEYLMQNPELKISYLCIDLDDYESALTALQFFYPRLMHGGILVLDNYYKSEEDYRAVTDYFRFNKVPIQNFSVNKGPHFIVRK